MICWLRIRELVRKEFIQLFRDPKNKRLLIVSPIIQLMIFGYVMSTDVRLIKVGVLDQSQTRESRMLLDSLSANKIFQITHHTKSDRSFDHFSSREKSIWPSRSVPISARKYARVTRRASRFSPTAA